VLAVAMDGGNSLVASSGREGGAKLSRFDAGDGGLRFAGEVPGLDRPLPGARPSLVTCIEFDSLGRLFLGGQDGLLRMVTFDEDFSPAGGSNDGWNEMMQVKVVTSQKELQQEPLSPILSLDISEELDMVATAHADGNVRVYSMNHADSTSGNDDNLLGVWNPFADTNSHARSVAFISGSSEDDDDDTEDGNEIPWSIVAGGGNGMLWMQEIAPSHISSSISPSSVSASDDDESTAPDRAPAASQPLFKANSAQQIEPSHQGPVLSLAARPGGILVSAAHDGMLRVTKVWPTPKPLYGLGGYKVWMGSVCIDSEGKRLLSDGRDDVVVVHDFSKDAAEGEDLE